MVCRLLFILLSWMCWKLVLVVLCGKVMCLGVSVDRCVVVLVMFSGVSILVCIMVF